MAEPNDQIIIKANLSDRNRVLVTTTDQPTREELDRLIEMLVVIRNGY